MFYEENLCPCSLCTVIIPSNSNMFWFVVCPYMCMVGNLYTPISIYLWRSYENWRLFYLCLCMCFLSIILSNKKIPSKREKKKLFYVLARNIFYDYINSYKFGCPKPILLIPFPACLSISHATFLRSHTIDNITTQMILNY